MISRLNIQFRSTLCSVGWIPKQIGGCWGNYLELNFGFSVATAGDVNGDGNSDIIIGAPGYDYDLPDRGYVEVYHGSPIGPNWETANKSYYGDASDTWFGYSVATAGDINGDGYSDVIIGAPLWDSGIYTDGGKAYVYKGSPTGLENSPHWTLQSDRTDDVSGPGPWLQLVT